MTFHLNTATPTRFIVNPIEIMRHLWRYRQLTYQFTQRQVLARYRGSYLGVVWSFITPLAMLLIYTFVFSVVFQARWEQHSSTSHAEFALTLFAGLIAFNIFNEVIIAAPQCIISQPNLVKRVIFPLEILPVSLLGSALVNSAMSLVILLLGLMSLRQPPSWTIIFLPLIYLPLSLLTLGLGWFLAALGVFIRDITPILAVIMQMLFFLTPIFYPVSALPPHLQWVLYLNPLTFIVNHFRRVILWGQPPDWGEWLVITLFALGVWGVGFGWFMRSKKSFADVV